MKMLKISLLTIMCACVCTSAQAKNIYAKRKSIKGAVQKCEKAYRAAKSSPSTGIVFSATEDCEKATEAACTALVESKSDGAETGDGRYIAAMCALNAAYGGNKTVNKGSASPKCEKAYRDALKSPSTGDVTSAADLCKSEQDAACEKMVNESSDGPETGDGRLVGATCSLISAHGAYLEVTPKTRNGPGPDPASSGR